MKTAIYLRVSSLEQDPQNQRAECLAMAKNRGYDVEGIYIEEVSAFKGKSRPQYDIIKQKAFKREIDAVIVWALDRWVRNRDTLLEDVTVLKAYGVKLHSYKEAWLEVINIEGPLGRTIQDFLLGLLGSLAEMESQRKSDRMKIAYSNRKGRWGRKSIPKVTQEKILEARKAGMTLREISQKVSYYDKNNKPQFVSVGLVHKIISNSKQEISTPA